MEGTHSGRAEQQPGRCCRRHLCGASRGRRRWIGSARIFRRARGRRRGCTSRRSLSRRIHVRDIIRGGRVLLSVLLVIQLLVIEVFLAVTFFLLVPSHLVVLLFLLVCVHALRAAGEPTRATGGRGAGCGGSPRRRRGTRRGLVHPGVEEILDGVEGG